MCAREWRERWPKIQLNEGAIWKNFYFKKLLLQLKWEDQRAFQKGYNFKAISWYFVLSLNNYDNV